MLSVPGVLGLQDEVKPHSEMPSLARAFCLCRLSQSVTFHWLSIWLTLAFPAGLRASWKHALFYFCLSIHPYHPARRLTHVTGSKTMFGYVYTSTAAWLFIITSLTRLWQHDLNYPFVIRLHFVLLALVAHFKAMSVSLRLPWQLSSCGHPSNTLQTVEKMPEPHKDVSWQEKVKHEMPGRGISSSSFFVGKSLAQSNQWVWSQLANH